MSSVFYTVFVKKKVANLCPSNQEELKVTIQYMYMLSLRMLDAN